MVDLIDMLHPALAGAVLLAVFAIAICAIIAGFAWTDRRRGHESTAYGDEIELPGSRSQATRRLLGKEK